MVRRCFFVALALGATFLPCVAQVAQEAQPFVPANRWALVVGVSQYSADLGKLHYTAKEAREFAGELTGKLGFEPENVRLLADGGEAAQAPTSANILGTLDSLLSDKRLDKGNLFVFYFSGHGIGSDSADYLLPSDTALDKVAQMGVPVEQVISRIVNAGLKNVIFIADACRAGKKNEFGTHLIELCRKAHIAVILGCSPGKRSYEYPALQQGAFTHFLIQGLNDPKLRDASGALWASSVGQYVRTQVHDYTEPDHGAFAQVPAVWAEQSTLDVLIGAYLQSPVSDKAVELFKDSAKRLDRKDFAAALTYYANELFIQDRYDQASQLLNTVNQLDELTPAARYLLALSLDFQGRSGEADRVFVTFKDMPDGYYKDLAYISSSSRSIAPEERLAAARRVFDQISDWDNKLLAFTEIRNLGTYDERLDAARKFASLKAPSERWRLYAAGCLADEEGKYQESVADFRRAMDMPGDKPDRHLLTYVQLRPILGMNDPKALDDFIERSLNDNSSAVLCYTERAWLEKNRHETDKELNDLREALKRDPSPGQLWTIAKVAGFHIGRLADEIRAAALKHPYSWEANVLLAFLDASEKNTQAYSADIDKSDLYREDPVTYDSKVFELMDGIEGEAVYAGKGDEMQYRRQVDFFFLTMLQYAPTFGYDVDLWSQLLEFGMLNERTSQLAVLIKKYFPIKLERTPKDLRPILVFVALDTGDADMIERLHRTSFDPAEGYDPAWMYAAYLTTQGKEAEALELVQTLGPATFNLEPRMEAMRTYLLAKAGHRDEALARLKTEVNDLVVRAFDGLAWNALGNWDKAEPLFFEQAKSRNWAFLFVSEYCMRILDKHLRDAGRLEDARMLAVLAAASQPGNPLFAKYTFVEKPGVAQFAGNFQMDGVAVDDRIITKSMVTSGTKAYVFGTLRYAVDTQGNLKGAFTEENGTPHPFDGKIDALGNLAGQASWVGKRYALTGKIAPPALYSTFAPFKDYGQILQMIDDDGFRVDFVVFPDKLR